MSEFIPWEEIEQVAKQHNMSEPDITRLKMDWFKENIEDNPEVLQQLGGQNVGLIKQQFFAKDNPALAQQLVQGRREPTLLESALNALGDIVGKPLTVEAGRPLSPEARAQATVELAARQEGVPVEQYREATKFESFPQAFVGEATAGLVPALEKATKGTEPQKPIGKTGKVLSKLGSVAGFGLMAMGIPSPSRIPFLGKLLRTSPKAVETAAAKLAETGLGRDEIVQTLASKLITRAIPEQAIHLGLATAATNAGRALQQRNVKDAAKVLRHAAVSGAITGGIFGVLSRMFPADVAQRAGRILTGTIALQAQRILEDPKHRMPWKQADPYDLVTDLGMGVFFLWNAGGLAALEEADKAFNSVNGEPIEKVLSDHVDGKLSAKDILNLDKRHTQLKYSAPYQIYKAVLEDVLKQPTPGEKVNIIDHALSLDETKMTGVEPYLLKLRDKISSGEEPPTTKTKEPLPDYVKKPELKPAKRIASEMEERASKVAATQAESQVTRTVMPEAEAQVTPRVAEEPGNIEQEVANVVDSILSEEAVPPEPVTQPGAKAEQETTTPPRSATEQETILTKDGRPFKNKGIASLVLKRKGLADTHTVQEVEGGWAIVPSATERPLAETKTKKPSSRGTITVYEVNTEERGSFESRLIRNKDGSVAIINRAPDGVTWVSEYNSEFARDKSDKDIMAYLFEPLGYIDAKQISETIEHKPKTTRVELSEAQKSFIRNKVRQLGSLDAVKRIYPRSDDVSKYAISVAEQLYGEETTKTPTTEGTSAEQITKTGKVHEGVTGFQLSQEGERKVSAAEGMQGVRGSRPKEVKAGETKTPETPSEEKLKEIVESAGATWVGIQENPKGEPLALFNDKAGSTQAIRASELTKDKVKKILKASKPEETQATGVPPGSIETRVPAGKEAIAGADRVLSEPEKLKQPISEAVEQPWRGATPDDESRWFGTKVTITPEEIDVKAAKEEGKPAPEPEQVTLNRVLNKGKLLEVYRGDDPNETFRIPSDRVARIDKLVDNKQATEVKSDSGVPLVREKYDFHKDIYHTYDEIYREAPNVVVVRRRLVYDPTSPDLKKSYEYLVYEKEDGKWVRQKVEPTHTKALRYFKNVAEAKPEQKPYEGLEPGTSEWMRVWKKHPELQDEMLKYAESKKPSKKELPPKTKVEPAPPETKTQEEKRLAKEETKAEYVVAYDKMPREISKQPYLPHVADEVKKWVNKLRLAVKDFRKHPVMEVVKDDQGRIRLRYSDSYKFTFWPDLFNIDPGLLKEGQKIRFDLDSFRKSRRKLTGEKGILSKARYVLTGDGFTATKDILYASNITDMPKRRPNISKTGFDISRAVKILDKANKIPETIEWVKAENTDGETFVKLSDGVYVPYDKMKFFASNVDKPIKAYVYPDDKVLYIKSGDKLVGLLKYLDDDSVGTIDTVTPTKLPKPKKLNEGKFGDLLELIKPEAEPEKALGKKEETTKNIRVENNRVYAKVKYDPEIVKRFKQIDGYKYHPDTKEWSFPEDKRGQVEKVLSEFENLDEKIWELINEADYGSKNEPEYPKTWNHLKREYVAILNLKDGKLDREFLGKRTNFSSSRKNADIEYNEDELPDALPVGTVLEVKKGSHKHMNTHIYRKDANGWKYIVSREGSGRFYGAGKETLSELYSKLKDTARRLADKNIGLALTKPLRSEKGAVEVTISPKTRVAINTTVKTAKDTTRALETLTRRIQAVFEPSKVSPLAAEVALRVREARGKTYEAVTRLEQKLEKLKDDIDRLPKQAIDEAQYLYETGQADKITDPALRKFFTGVIGELDRLSLHYINETNKLLGREAFTGLSHYLAHIYKDPNKAATVLAEILSSGHRTEAGFPQWFKKRLIETYKKAEELGLERRFKNPVDTQMFHVNAVIRWAETMRHFKALKDDGLIKFFRVGEKGNELRAQHPDWVRLKDPAFTALFPTEKGVVVAGSYYATPDIARILNNNSSRGLSDFKAFQALRSATNFVNMLNMTISAFHATFTSFTNGMNYLAMGLADLPRLRLKSAARNLTRAALSAPLPIQTIIDVIEGRRMIKASDYNPMTKFYMRSGGKIGLDPWFDITYTRPERLLKQALAEGKLKGLRNPALLTSAILDKLNTPVMRVMVPALKIHAFEKLLLHEMENRNISMPIDEFMQTKEGKELGQHVVDLVEDRFGQMNYDNLHWNRFLKHALQLTLRTVGWNYGDIREVAGAGASIGSAMKEMAKGDFSGAFGKINQRVYFTAAVPILHMWVSGLLTWLLTGERPKGKDWIAPRTKSGERYSLPSYFRDWIALRYQGLPTTIKHKLNPIWNIVADQITNTDYWGTKLTNRNDPKLVQLWDRAEHVGEQMFPFSVQSITRTRSRTGKGLSIAGLTKAPTYISRTPLQRLIFELYDDEHHGEIKTKSEAEAQRFKAKIRQKAQETGTVPYEMIREARQKGYLPSYLSEQMFKGTLFTQGYQRAFKGLSAESQLEVLKKANQKELMELWKYTKRRAKNDYREWLRRNKPRIHKKLAIGG